MKIALPVAQGKFCSHFGHCEEFIFFTVDENDQKIISKTSQVPPPHEPGVLPMWISQQGVQLVLAGGMGHKAQELFLKNGVKVVTGIVDVDPEAIVREYLNRSLKTGKNCCDH